MYGLTLAAALWLEGRPAGSVGVAAAGVLLGWPFSVLATAPLVLHATLFGGFKTVFGMGAAASLGVLVRFLPLAACVRERERESIGGFGEGRHKLFLGNWK